MVGLAWKGREEMRSDGCKSCHHSLTQIQLIKVTDWRKEKGKGGGVTVWQTRFI